MKISGENSLQNTLFEKIKSIIPKNTSFPEELADLLELSTDSVYRRLRNETSLTIDEVHLLCSHYRISFDSLCINKSNTVSFAYNSLQSDESGFEKYLRAILDHITIINKNQHKQIIYLAEDLPIFYNFSFRELSAFKMFYWMKSMINVASYDNKKFDPAIISEELLQIARQIYDTYLSIPSIEIWTDSSILSLLKQIEYYWDSGHFQKAEDALLLCDQVVFLLNQIQQQAQTNTKVANTKAEDGNQTNFKLYLCEIEIGNNCIHIKTGETKSVYITHLTFNKLLTTNLDFCNDTEEWLETLIKKSILISGASEKQRYRFFHNSLNEVNKLKERIQKQN